MRGFQRIAALLCVALMLAACHSHLLRGMRAKSCRKNDVAYVTATSVPTAAGSRGPGQAGHPCIIKIPALNEPEPPPRKPNDPCLDRAAQLCGAEAGAGAACAPDIIARPQRDHALL